MKFRKGLAAAVLGIAAAVTAATAGTAGAVIDPSVVNNTVGEAGWFVNNTNWHIRFVQAHFTVTTAMKDLNGVDSSSKATLGGVGAELCDNNSGYAAQVGVVYMSGQFRLAWDNGPLTPLKAGDPCISSGLVSQNPNFFGMNGITIQVGDNIWVSAYYSPGKRFRMVKFAVCDITQDVCNQANTGFIGWKTFYEAGVGVLDNNTPQLTEPANFPLVSFTGATFTDYSGQGGTLNGGWDLREANAVNGQGAVVLTPTAMPSATNWSPLDTAFSVNEGSVLPA